MRTTVNSLIDSFPGRKLTEEEMKALNYDIQKAFAYGFALGTSEVDLYRFQKKSKAKKAR